MFAYISAYIYFLTLWFNTVYADYIDGSLKRVSSHHCNRIRAELLCNWVSYRALHVTWKSSLHISFLFFRFIRILRGRGWRWNNTLSENSIRYWYFCYFSLEYHPGYFFNLLRVKVFARWGSVIYIETDFVKRFFSRSYNNARVSVNKI